MYFGKDAKGKWFVQFSYLDWTGKRVRTTKRGFKTKKEAQEYYTNYMVMKSGELNMLFGDFVEIYINDMKSRIRENTMTTKEYIINLKILPYFKDKKINEITVSDVRQWQASLMESIGIE